MERMIDPVIKVTKERPDAVAYQFMGKKTTYGQFISQVERVAQSLVSVGVSEGDVVCVVMPNMPQAIIFIYAANMIGASVNMIHPLSSESEVRFFVQRVSAKAILILDQFVALVKNVSVENIIVASPSEALGPLKRLFVKKQPVPYAYMRWSDFIRKGIDSVLPQVSETASKTALILHSGGTTGTVKGVCLSNFSVNSCAYQMIKANPMLDCHDKFLSVMPIFHGNGLVVGIHTMLISGACCILIPRFNPETYARDLLRNKCNYMSGVPALFEKLISVDIMQKADLSFLKGVFSGADYLSVELEQKINRFLQEHNCKVPVRQGYGMTEGVVATTLNPWDFQKPGSIGKALDGVDIKIVTPGTENEVSVGETGEIVFSSDTNMTCYFNNPEETAMTMRKHSDGKYWIHSGDLGFVDNDGFYFFKGRIKRMIVVNGYNIFPNEIENTIEGFDIVSRCCIVPYKISEGSTKIKAYIVLKDDVEKSEETRIQITTLCRENMSRYAVPKIIEFIEELPRTKVGKVDYNALIKLQQNNQLSR